MTDVTLKDGRVAHFPDGMDNAAIDRALREYYTKSGGDTSPPSGPQVPSGPEGTDQPGIVSTYKPDPSQLDDWGPWVDKQVKSGLRGTALGFGDLADFVWNRGIRNPGRILYNDINYGLGGDPANYYSDAETRAYDPTVRNAIESNIIPQPEGSSYENTANVSEIFGPAAVEALVTGGLSIPESIAAAGPSAARVAMTVPKTMLKAGVKTARDTGLGIVGGEAGAVVGEKIGGDTGRDLGMLLGAGATAAGAPALAEYALSKGLTGPQSKGRLASIDEANKSLPPDQQIPVSLGLVGRKNVGTLEDITGRTLFSNAAEDVRRQQFSGMEQGIRNALNNARGGPAGGQITKSGIGTDAKNTVLDARIKAQADLQRIQRDLESQVGAKSPVNMQNTADELNAIANEPSLYDTEIRAQAADLRNRLLGNLQAPPRHPLPPYTGPKPLVRPKPVTAGTAGYSAARVARSRLGRSLDRNQKPIDKMVQERAYSGMTKDMEEAAAMQGVDPADFAAAQAETKRLAEQGKILKKQSPEGATETDVYNRTVGRDNPEQLKPMLEHSPDQLVRLLVDDLELQLRGDSAGKTVNPDLFVPEAFDAWRGMTPERKAIIARNNPEVVSRMDALSEVALAEEARGGKRTRPGRTGSTLGASMGYILPGALGIAGGYSASGGGLLPALAGITGGMALPYAAGRLLTNPAFARRMVNPEMPSLSQIMSRAIGGQGASVNVQTDPLTQQRAREENQRQRQLRGM